MFPIHDMIAVDKVPVHVYVYRYMCIVKPENSKGNNFAESKIVRDDNR